MADQRAGIALTSGVFAGSVTIMLLILFTLRIHAVAQFREVVLFI